MIDTIYFDNWNTLVQAPDLMRRGSSTEVFHRYLTEQGIDLPYEMLVEVYVPVARAQEREAEEAGYREPDYRQRLEVVFRRLGLDEAVKYSHGAWDYYLRLWPEQTEYFPGVPEMLRKLKESYKLGVITNYMDGPTCREVFDKLGFNEVFDSLVVSKELGYLKPASILFETAMRETGSVSENCLMVGDTYSADVVGGNMAGMRTVLVDLYDNQQDHYHDCTAVIRGINEFPDALRRLESS
ncbi:HAD family hydrolase [Candidatus Bathyarchaeota archaeon]|nr:MAG: HAD family hydrolase [Candidatus Bathyarchaeota archaeon]